MESRFTVLQVIPRMRSGGAELGCLQVAVALADAGHRALVVSEGGRMVGALEAAGARHIALPLSSKNPLRMRFNTRALCEIIRRENVDVIHARGRAPAWSALSAARSTGIPFVATYHSEYSERGRIKNLYNSVMVGGEKVIAVSDHMGALWNRAPAHRRHPSGVRSRAIQSGRRHCRSSRGIARAPGRQAR